MTSLRPNAIPATELSDLNAALEAAGIFVDVESRDGAIIVSGEVDSAEMRQAAIDLAGIVAQRHGLHVEDALEVLDIELDLGFGDRDDIGPANVQIREADTIYDVGTNDPDLAGEEAIPYFPPTDPVFGGRMTGQDEVEVIGGFQPTAMTGDDDGSPARLNDDERISDDVRRELREDAATTDLDVTVDTRNGTVLLIGEVAAVEDSDNAEAVAARVDGVVEIRNELTIVGPIGDRHGI